MLPGDLAQGRSVAPLLQRLLTLLPLCRDVLQLLLHGVFLGLDRLQFLFLERGT